MLYHRVVLMLWTKAYNNKKRFLSVFKTFIDSLAQLARYQLSRSHNSVIFTRVDTQDYAK